MISAFCSLTRPTRREIAQAEDLCLPLLDAVSAEDLRFAAAALSECRHAPAALVQRLADQPIEIAAPLLSRSTALGEVDLVRLIARHGRPHARAIARRPDPGATVRQLLAALKREETAQAGPAEPGTAVEATRNRLRALMRPAGQSGDHAARQRAPRGVRVIPAISVTAKLRESALTGTPAIFHAALAGALGVSTARAAAIASARSPDDLVTALKALDLGADQAFVVAAATRPGRFAHAEAIRLFLAGFEALDAEEARGTLRIWQVEDLSSRIGRPGPRPAPASKGDASDGGSFLKAS